MTGRRARGALAGRRPLCLARRRHRGLRRRRLRLRTAHGVEEGRDLLVVQGLGTLRAGQAIACHCASLSIFVFLWLDRERVAAVASEKPACERGRTRGDTRGRGKMRNDV